MCRVDSLIFEWRLHFLIQIIVLAACLQKTAGFARIWLPAHAKFACDRLPVAYKLYPSGRQLHINCTRVAASRIYIVPEWSLVACKLYPSERRWHATWIKLVATRVQFACDWWPLGYNLHATSGHSVRRQADKRCLKGHIYIIIIFFYHLHVHILGHASDYSAYGPWIFGLENLLVLWMKSHAEANFARASGQLRAKSPLFCKHAAKTIFWIKKWGCHLKIWESTRHMSLISAIHQHYVWPDPIS